MLKATHWKAKKSDAGLEDKKEPNEWGGREGGGK